MIAPRFRCGPTVSLAARKGPKSGWCAASTGVGTATTMKSAVPRSAASVVTRSPDEDSNSARLTSPVGSWQSRYAAIFLWERSKPIVGYFFPNSTAKGKPTYPKPTTATTVTSTPFVVFTCVSDPLVPDPGGFRQEDDQMGYSVFSSAATSAAQSGPQVSAGVLAIDACRDCSSAPVPLASVADLPAA